MTNFTTELGKAIKYLTEKKEDLYPAIMAPENAGEVTPHFMLSDFLREQGEDELADRIKKQATLTGEGVKPKPARLNDDSDMDHKAFVLKAVRTGHPNPTVRAFAGQQEDHNRYDTSDLLFHSPHHHDHDVAVWLALPDPQSKHSTHDLINRIGSWRNRNQGLEVKTVRGTTYLLDHENPDPKAFGAPRILFTSPVNDRAELEAMLAHADGIGAQRQAEQAHFEGAHVGPAT